MTTDRPNQIHYLMCDETCNTDIIGDFKGRAHVVLSNVHREGRLELSAERLGGHIGVF
jgi:hypothetical protein